MYSVKNPIFEGIFHAKHFCAIYMGIYIPIKILFFYVFCPAENASSCISKVSYFQIIWHTDSVHFLFADFLNIIFLP